MIRLLSCLSVLLVVGCSHPLEIVGEGDIESSTGANDCALEEQPCANYVTGDYNVTYTAAPREGWNFVGWEGCGVQFPECSFNIPALYVDQNWFQTMPTLRAVFVEGLGPGVPGIRVGSVRGNTVAAGSAAEFSISLNTQPTDNVTVSVMSSDESEGLPEESEFTFTPDNWEQGQTVVVRGQNGTPDDHIQNYHILFGPALSGDISYSGLLTPAVAMRGLSLSLLGPATELRILPQTEFSRVAEFEYTGFDDLIFDLTAAPSGMIIDSETGLISWVPDVGLQGQFVEVAVSVTDGLISDTRAIQIEVLEPTVLSVQATSNSIEVTSAGSLLDGLRISTDEANSIVDFGQIELAALDIEEAVSLPDWISPLTDVLVLPDIQGVPLQLRMPLMSLPEGTPLDDVELFAFVQRPGGEGGDWLPISHNYFYEGSLENPVYVAEVENLLGMALVGVDLSVGNPPNTLAMARSLALQNSNQGITCVPEASWWLSEPNYDKQECSAISKPNFVYRILDFGESNNQWGGATIEELVQWLVDAQVAMDELGVLYEPTEITVKLTGSPCFSEESYGCVSALSKKKKVLYLNNDPSNREWHMRPTAVHEYFHHGQANTPHSDPDKESVINVVSNHHWLIEGTAAWFEDYVYDTENSYETFFRTPMPPIMEAGLKPKLGLNDYFSASSGRKDPYRRFSFFKLLEEKCVEVGSQYKDFLGELFGVDEYSDRHGIVNLSEVVANAGCNFGGHLGEEARSSLEAALVYYQYATLRRKDMRLLDSIDEPLNFDHFTRSNHEFVQGANDQWPATVDEWLQRENDARYTLGGVTNIPPSGAYSFFIDGIAGSLPSSHTALLKVDSDSDVLVSMRSESSSFSGDNMFEGKPHSWFLTTTKTKHEYGGSDGVPEVFVTLVNTSLSSGADVEVSFNIVEKGVEITDTVVVDGKEWAQVDLFLGVPYFDLLDVCPSGVCSGSLNGYDVSGWTWSSSTNVQLMFLNYLETDFPVDQQNVIYWQVPPHDDPRPRMLSDGWRFTTDGTSRQGIEGLHREMHPSWPICLASIGWRYQEFIGNAYGAEFGGCPSGPGSHAQHGAWIYRDIPNP